jgi:hypothetical protein
MGTLFFILGLVLIVVAAIVVYKTAEVHELHKMRAAFEDKRHYLEGIINQGSDSKDYYLGELHELEELETLIDEELEILKDFDFGSSD